MERVEGNCNSRGGKGSSVVWQMSAEALYGRGSSGYYKGSFRPFLLSYFEKAVGKEFLEEKTEIVSNLFEVFLVCLKYFLI